MAPAEMTFREFAERVEKDWPQHCVCTEVVRWQYSTGNRELIFRLYMKAEHDATSVSLSSPSLAGLIGRYEAEILKLHGDQSDLVTE